MIIISEKHVRILITGANGFLGSSLVSKLEGQDVVRFNGASNKQKDGGVSVDLRKAIPVVKDIDVCFHFAALTDLQECEKNPAKATEVNATGTRKLLEMLKQHSRAPFFVYISTLGVCSSNEPINSSTPIKPTSSYAASKSEGEKVTQYYSKFFSCITARVAFPYGKASPANRFVQRLAKKIERGDEILLNVGGKPLCNPAFVDDITSGFLKLLRFKPKTYKAYSLGGPSVYSVRQIAETISGILGKAPLFRETGQESYNFIADNLEARNDFGYEPKTDLHEGLLKTLG